MKLKCLLTGHKWTFRAKLTKTGLKKDQKCYRCGKVREIPKKKSA